MQFPHQGQQTASRKADHRPRLRQSWIVAAAATASSTQLSATLPRQL
jgi:hypothetical protein